MADTNAKGKPVAVVVGATSKWQSDGRNTRLAHGTALDDSATIDAVGSTQSQATGDPTGEPLFGLQWDMTQIGVPAAQAVVTISAALNGVVRQSRLVIQTVAVPQLVLKPSRLDFNAAPVGGSGGVLWAPDIFLQRREHLIVKILRALDAVPRSFFVFES